MYVYAHIYVYLHMCIKKDICTYICFCYFFNCKRDIVDISWYNLKFRYAFTYKFIYIWKIGARVIPVCPFQTADLFDSIVIFFKLRPESRFLINDRQVIMSGNTRSLNARLLGQRKCHGRILVSTIQRRSRSPRHLRISNYEERSYPREATSQSSELARNGIVGPVIPLRPANVMTKYMRFCRARCEYALRTIPMVTKFLPLPFIQDILTHSIGFKRYLI